MTYTDEYRTNLGRGFAKKHGVTLQSGDARVETRRIYDEYYNEITRRLKGASVSTLAILIECTPRASTETTHLLLPRADFHGMESLNSLGLSGREYLETLAYCAIVVAIYDYLRAQSTTPISSSEIQQPHWLQHAEQRYLLGYPD